MNRQDKIDLLKKISNGKIKMNELKMNNAVVIYYPNGTYTLRDAGQRNLEAEEIETFTNKVTTILFLPDNGRD